MSEIPPFQQPPPGYSNYPRGNMPGAPFQRPPGVYFDCIGDAWNLFQKNLGTWVLTTFICGALYVGVVIGMEVLFFVNLGGFGSTKSGGPPTPDFMEIALFCPVVLIIVCVFQVLFAGLMKMGVKQARGEPIAVGDVFSCFPDIVSIVGAGFLSGLAITIGTCLCIVPGLWLMGIFAFVPMLATDRKLGPIEVLQVSYDTFRPYAWPLFLLHLIASLIGGLGTIACYIGIIFTYPIYISIMGLAYNNFFPGEAQGNFVYTQPIGFEPPR